MKISEAIIQKRMIHEHTETTFHATYKRCDIRITSCHGHGKPKYDHLTRYDIEVHAVESGTAIVSTWEDFHTMHDAILYALRGACLIAGANIL
jgi:hypothetical protein